MEWLVRSTRGGTTKHHTFRSRYIGKTTLLPSRVLYYSLPSLVMRLRPCTISCTPPPPLPPLPKQNVLFFFVAFTLHTPLRKRRGPGTHSQTKNASRSSERCRRCSRSRSTCTARGTARTSWRKRSTLSRSSTRCSHRYARSEGRNLCFVSPNSENKCIIGSTACSFSTK